MPAPVWVLSVDLQTKTATFQSGMADAARAARGSFTEIKAGADDMSRASSGSMMEARHGVMLLGEEFGVHLPRGITSFITSLGPVAAAMEAAFPFIAIAVGATLLIEHLVKMREAAEKAADAHVDFGTAAQKSLNALDDKLLRAGIAVDELNDDHMAALKKELELIDHASLNELMAELDALAKHADADFATMKTSWYQFSAGSAGAKHSLEEFKRAYDHLLSTGKNDDAAALLDTKVAREREILRLQEQARDSQAQSSRGGQSGNYVKYEEAKLALKKLGVGFDELAISSQQTLVDVLNDQLTAQQKIAELKSKQTTLATGKEDKRADAEEDKRWKEQAKEQKQGMDDEQKAWDEHYKEAVSRLQESERAKIDATETGSQARLAAIDVAIKEEQSKGLQETSYYKGLLLARVNLVREMGQEEKKLQAEAGKEAAQHERTMGELTVAAAREQDHHANAMKRQSYDVMLGEAISAENSEYEVKQQAFQKEIDALNTHDKDYENKLKALQNREAELVQQHENKITRIKDKAEEERNAKILAGAHHFDDEIARGSAKTIMGQESFAKMMTGLGSQIASGMMENAIKMVMANDYTKMSDAKWAARQGWKAGMHFPWPVDLVMAPTLAALGFASMMAFEKGGIVPGYSVGDSVPIMATPGEGIIPKKLMEGLTRMSEHGNGMEGNAGNSGGDRRPSHSVQIVQNLTTKDADSFKHSQAQLHSKAFHAANTASKRNR